MQSGSAVHRFESADCTSTVPRLVVCRDLHHTSTKCLGSTSILLPSRVVGLQRKLLAGSLRGHADHRKEGIYDQQQDAGEELQGWFGGGVGGGRGEQRQSALASQMCSCLLAALSKAVP